MGIKKTEQDRGGNAIGVPLFDVRRKMKTKKETPTYDGEVLQGLAFEFSSKDHAESERKIKRRLREKKLGTYDQQRIDAIRAFKDELQKELGKNVCSEFYVGSDSKCDDMADWNYEKLLEHMKSEHPKVDSAAIEGVLSYAIYLYYLR